MLGELYALENEGNEIALSLCQQDVNIDDRHWKYWYRLALVRFWIAPYESAMVLCERVCNWSEKIEKHYISPAGYMIKWECMLRRQKCLRRFSELNRGTGMPAQR
jgi:hypothetical protein